MSEFESISSFLKMIGFIKSLFWKNKNVVYINGNVKVLNVEKIRHLISPTDSKYINCQSKKSNKLFSYKWHFFKQKINLIQIVRNCMDSSKLTYCGFSSQMFSVFDGYILGDTLNYNFIELKANNQYYLIAKKNKFSKFEVEINDSVEEINIVVETSYKIDNSKIPNFPTIKFCQHEPSKITNDFLNEVYSYVKSALDECCSKNIKIVNMYMTAKQSVAFVVGTAIQSYHPLVKVYNFDNNSYRYYLEIQSGRIREVI